MGVGPITVLAVLAGAPAGADSPGDAEPETTAQNEGSSGSWGPIAAACVGILVGAIIARRQIRWMKSR